MFKFIVKRLMLCVVILFFVMLIVYTIMHSLPTSYVETVARELATRPGSTKSYQVWLAELNSRFGMDKGIFEGYFVWLKTAVRGDFGDSWFYGIPVIAEFKRVIWNSFFLGLVAMIIELVVAIPLGVVAAKKQYSVTDYTVTVFSLIGISLPTFFVATILKMIFAVKLGWLDISGMRGRDFLNMNEAQQFFDVLAHFIMPLITLVIISIGGMMRYTRTNMLEVLNSDYIRTARAKGLSERRVINHHAFRNTLIPLVTIIGGMLPSLFAGALITETLFAIDGIGFISYNAMRAGDIPFTMFYMAFMAVLTLVGTLISDILYAVVDPRVRIN
ncbi:MAG: ABC transporter permease [Clostridia bacterium]